MGVNPTPSGADPDDAGARDAAAGAAPDAAARRSDWLTAGYVSAWFGSEPVLITPELARNLREVKAKPT